MPNLSSTPTKSNLVDSLQKHRDEVKHRLKTKHSHAAQWLRHTDTTKLLTSKPAKLFSGLSLAGSLLLSPPQPKLALPPAEKQARLADAGYQTAVGIKKALASKLIPHLPNRVGHAPPEKEAEISQIIQKYLGIDARPELEGNRLNHTIGYIGLEQHLRRFPGDGLHLHDEHQDAGIAPLLGAWGYFASSQAELAPEVIDKEKYYFAVQTLYLPDWNTNHRYLKNWYRHRKMLAINPETGDAVVGVVADAGPAQWTGKQFGGSPEVMSALDLYRKKGKIILYLVHDPENKIPLGPVNQNYRFTLARQT